MTPKEKMLRRLREIASILDSDMSWIDAQRRHVFVEQLLRERDEGLDLVLQEAPAPADRRDARGVIAHLRKDPADAAKADALEAWIARA